MKRHVSILVFTFALGLALVVDATGMLNAKRHPDQEDRLRILIGVCLCSYVLLLWWRFARGAILFRTKEVVNLNGGAIRFCEPKGRYALWLFCNDPFGCYRGDITILRGRTRHVIQIPFTGWERIKGGSEKDYSPIVWRPPEHEPREGDWVHVNFHLTPQLGYTAFFPAPESGVVEMIVKTAR